MLLLNIFFVALCRHRILRLGQRPVILTRVDSMTTNSTRFGGGARFFLGVLVRLRTRAAARAVQILTVIGEFFSQNRPQCPNFGQGGASGASVSLRLRPAGAKEHVVLVSSSSRDL